MDEPKSAKIRRWFDTNLLLVHTLFGVVVGLFTGALLRLSEPSDVSIMLVAFPGEILVRMLKMLMLPLIVSSLIVGLSAFNLQESGRMGRRALVYYSFTTITAVIVGVICVILLHPGIPSSKGNRSTGGTTTQTTDDKVNAIDAVLDILRNIFPDNIVRAAYQQVDTEYELRFSKAKNITEKIRIIRYLGGTNALGMITIWIVFGALLGKLGEKTIFVLEVMSALNVIVTKLIYAVMWYSPIGIASLIAGKILESENLQQTIPQLSMFVATVVIGLVFHTCITLPLTYFFTTRRNPFVFMKGILNAWITALATSSSLATLPVTFRCLEETLHMDTRVTRFMLPIGCTVNMDGTALYETVGAIFLAQLNGIELGMGQIVTISVIATLASVGVTSVPGPATVTMMLVLETIGLPTDDIHLILSIEWFMERMRASVNVIGDAFGVGIVAYLSKEELDQMTRSREGSVRTRPSF